MDVTRGPERLLKVLLTWTSFTTLMFWLPTVRGAFDGASYEWGVLGFAGKGIDGSYWFPVLGSTLSIIMLWMGWRGTRFPFHLLLGGWHCFLAIGLTVVVLDDPEGFHIVGDTAGMDIDLALIGPVFFGAWALLAIWWIVRDLRRKRATVASEWSRTNTRWLAGLIALLPVQFALLRSGTMDSTQDLLGVLITVVQWMLLARAFSPGRTARAKQIVVLPSKE